MANTRYNGRWVLDTVATVVSAGTAVRLMSALFYAATNNYTFTLQDGNAKEICKGKLGTIATVGNQMTIDFGKEGTIVDGLILSSLSDGATLFLYLGKL